MADCLWHILRAFLAMAILFGAMLTGHGAEKDDTEKGAGPVPRTEREEILDAEYERIPGI